MLRESLYGGGVMKYRDDLVYKRIHSGYALLNVVSWL